MEQQGVDFEERQENEQDQQENNIIKAFNEREFEEVEGGEYLENGYYVTPNGSFWDGDGVYFNRQGYDVHDGYYDTEYEYHPGTGWIPHLLCYEDELSDKGGEEDGEKKEFDYENIDDLHDEIDYGNLAENKDKNECIIKHNILTFLNRKKSSVDEKKVESLQKEA